MRSACLSRNEIPRTGKSQKPAADNTKEKGKIMDNQNQAPPQREAPTQAAQEKNQPADVMRDGALKASIWENESENGIYYATTLAKTYESKNGALRDTHNFTGNDLLRVAELARQAYAKINELRAELTNNPDARSEASLSDQYQEHSL